MRESDNLDILNILIILINLIIFLFQGYQGYQDSTLSRYFIDNLAKMGEAPALARLDALNTLETSPKR